MTKNYDIFKTNILYVFLTIVFLILGSYVQSKDFYIGIFVTEYLIVLMPVILFGLLSKVNLKKALRLNKIKIKTAFKIVILAFFLLPVIASANLIVITILSIFGKVIVPPIPEAKTTADFLIQLFFISFSAGLCEEMFFRGMILNAYEKYLNKKYGVIFAAVLFGLFHYNIQNLFGPIILGLVFGYLVQVTNSIFAAIIAHMANNGFAVLISFLSKVSASKESVDIFNNTKLLAGQLFASILFATISSVVVFLLIRSIVQEYRGIKVNDKIYINDNSYKVINVDDEMTYIENDKTNELKKINSKKLIKKKIPRTLKVWDEPLNNKPNINYFIPLMISVIIYFVVLNLQLKI